MPNWCMNYLNITGVDDVQVVIEMVSSEDDEFDVSKFSPDTANQRVCDSQLVNYTDGSMFYRFDSAWSPPEDAILELAEKLPTCQLTLQYYEPGMMSAGEIRYAGGGVDTEMHYSGSEDPAEYYDFLFVNELESTESYAKTDSSYEYFSMNCESDSGAYILYHNEYEAPAVNSTVIGVVNNDDDDYIESELIVYNGDGYAAKLNDGRVVNFGD